MILYSMKKKMFINMAFKSRKSLLPRVLIKNYPLQKTEEVMFIVNKDRLLRYTFKECRFIYSNQENLRVNGALCGMSLSGTEILTNYNVQNLNNWSYIKESHLTSSDKQKTKW